MHAAIYARRSTEEHQAASLDVQLEEAKRYIASKGWTLGDEHIFIEDAVSRAEFKKRPALIRMLNAARDGAFGIVVTRDETRLGGDVNRTGLLIQDLLESGVALYYYFTDERVTLDGAVAKFVVAARNFAAELEREKIAQRTREHLMVKARRGLNAGGRVFGYDNCRTDGRVEYKINVEQAEIVREIFRRRHDGEGYRAIAIKLNERGVQPPRAGKRGTGSWSPSAIRAMLSNEKYVGIFVYGKHEKAYRGGTKVRLARPSSEWITVERLDLAIVDRELFDAVQPEQRAPALSKPGPRRTNLLTGLAKCGECGGPMHVIKSRFGNERVRLYMCAWHRNRGASVCSNSVRRPADVVEDGVLEWIRERVLREEVIIETLAEVRQRLRERANAAASEITMLEKQARKLRTEIDNLVSALSRTTNKPEPVLDAISERNQRLKELEARISASKIAPTTIELETRRMEKEAKARLDDLRLLLGRNPDEARKVVEAVLPEPLVFRPIGELRERRFEIEGVTEAGALFVVNEPASDGVITNVHVPTGIRTSVISESRAILRSSAASRQPLRIVR